MSDEPKSGPRGPVHSGAAESGGAADVLKISTVPYDAEGKKIDLEEHTVVREMGLSIPLQIKSQVLLETNVGQVANTIRRMCRDCAHYNQREWVNVIRKAQRGDMTQRQSVNEIRAALLSTQNAQIAEVHDDGNGDLDVEQALYSMGVCTALTENMKEMVAVHPMACCPDDVITPTAPQGFFKPASSEADKKRAKAYDNLFRAAKPK